MLFGPVSMPSSSFRYSDFLNEANRAAMHVRVGGQWVQKYARDADPEAPAGGASSNVLDLANWLILQLAEGTWKGKPVIGGDALSQRTCRTRCPRCPGRRSAAAVSTDTA